MYVDAGGSSVDEFVFSQGLTLSRSGRVKAKKQHQQMATFLQAQRDMANAEFCKRHDVFPIESRTLPRTPPNKGDVLSPYLMRKIPDENLDSIGNYFSDSSYISNINRDSSSSSEETRHKASTIGVRRGKKPERSISVEGRKSGSDSSTGEKYSTMTLNRAGRKRNKYGTSNGFVRLTRRDALVPQSGNDFIDGKIPSFLDENYNHEPTKKGQALIRLKKKDSTTDSDEDFVMPRRNTFGTTPRNHKKSPRPTKKSESDECLKSEITLEEMLRHKAALQSFRDFLKSEHSEENLDFWLDCEQYKGLKGIKQDRMAVRIFTHYLSSSAPREVNIDSEIRRRTAESLKRPSNDTFLDAQNYIYCLMKCDPFRRFLTSEKFKKLGMKRTTIKKK